MIDIFGLIDSGWIEFLDNRYRPISVDIKADILWYSQTAKNLNMKQFLSFINSPKGAGVCYINYHNRGFC